VPCEGGKSPASHSEDLSSTQEPAHVTFVVDEVAREQILLPVIRFSSVSIIQPMLHTSFHISYQDKRANSCKPSNLAMLFEISGKIEGNYSNMDFFVLILILQRLKITISGTSFKNVASFLLLPLLQPTCFK
jgi:hypothetical protein